MEMPKKVALTTGLYSSLLVLINNNLFLLFNKSVHLETVEIVVILLIIVIAMTIGELIWRLCSGKGSNKCLRLIVGILTIFIMIIKALHA